ncbi:MAG: phenylalanine--tRNA ligase subunit alpha [Clostridia bacterium]|nr:MAG: phenylalanine--tRNA ligase subunit alpha [Clostridia bacterium]
MQEKITAIRAQAVQELQEVQDLAQLDGFRVKYLGKKGLITELLRSVGQLPRGERPEIGKEVNVLQEEIEAGLQARKDALTRQALELRLAAEAIDVTLPGLPVNLGRRHPVQQVMEEIQEIFIGMGFAVAAGPEIELDYYNFTALNIPPEHPARDMQDSFYVAGADEVLLRTHTSPVQIRVMEARQGALPVRIIAPGKVYRRDDDHTHSPMFHQVEGLLVDRGVAFAHLKGTLEHFVRQMFGPDTQMRLRPSYFPFTEPSAEVDISCVACRGEGCRVCGHSGWLEILGSGMVHPRVLATVGYDPAQVSGFAFGLGVERVAMLKYGLDDLRLFFANDLRFLRQFA